MALSALASGFALMSWHGCRTFDGLTNADICLLLMPTRSYLRENCLFLSYLGCTCMSWHVWVLCVASPGIASVGNAQTWLILPVVICLSQRLSHACLSISFYTAKLRMAH